MEDISNKVEVVESTSVVEKKKGFLGERLKYASLPLAVTAVAAFEPELRKKYEDLPKRTQYNVRTAGQALTVAAGAALVITGAYQLVKNYKSKHN